MKSQQVLLIAAGLIIIVVVAVLFAGVPSPLAGPGGPASLSAVEVRSYQGNDLSSVKDFRENSIKGPQHVNISDYRLTVTGLVNTTDVYTYDEVRERYPHYTKVVTLFCVEGLGRNDPLGRCTGPGSHPPCRARPRANTVVFTAHDGYTTSFPLDYLMNREIIMAYGMNNVTLPAERGYPFQLVAEDKWGYKWIKWIEKIELTDDPTYRGYWEQRGYSNKGDLDKSSTGP